jgi:hypothetical protein
VAIALKTTAETFRTCRSTFWDIPEVIYSPRDIQQSIEVDV